MDWGRQFALATEETGRKIHFIGGGGTGISALALLLHSHGWRVSASDQNNSEYLETLSAGGVTVWTGSHPEKIAGPVITVYSSAVPAQDPERTAAEKNGWPVFPRHILLAYLSEIFSIVSVCGTHGKTTTSAWLAVVLEECGYDPNAIIGGKIPRWQSNVRIGSGRWQGKPLLVMEADESDRSFLALHSRMAIITNMDEDHVDNYRNRGEILAAFREYMENTAAAGGQVTHSLECADEIRQLLGEKYAEFVPESGGLDIRDGELFRGGEKIALSLPGLHNRWNASAVYRAGLILGVPEDRLKAAMALFKGAGRRLEKAGEGCLQKTAYTILDDYAHHPREVEMTSRALGLPAEKLLILFEPHRISRFLHFYEDFCRVFGEIGWSRVVLLPFFTAGEKPENFPDFRNKLSEFGSRCGLDLSGGFRAAAAFSGLPSGGTMIFMGAGHSQKYARECASLLAPC